jgi:hypothetical protein
MIHACEIASQTEARLQSECDVKEGDHLDKRKKAADDRRAPLCFFGLSRFVSENIKATKQEWACVPLILLVTTHSIIWMIYGL